MQIQAGKKASKHSMQANTGCKNDADEQQLEMWTVQVKNEL